MGRTIGVAARGGVAYDGGMKFSAKWWGERAEIPGAPGRQHPGAKRWWRRWVTPVLRWFHRPSISGVEHLPRDRAFLLVANHNAALGVSEIFCLVSLKFEEFDAVPITALAHPFSFHIWPLTKGMAVSGAIPSTREAAMEALGAGLGVLVFPGGDHEVSRPVWQAGRVDFAGRTGFLRIARDAGVAVVPMGIAGSHYSAPVVWRSWLLPWLFVYPRVMGLKRYPLTLMSVAGAGALLATLPGVVGWGWAALWTWLWMLSPLTLLPWVPVTIRFRVGAPIEAEALFAEGGERGLEAAYATVVGRVQALVAGDRAADSPVD